MYELTLKFETKEDLVGFLNTEDVALARRGSAPKVEEVAATKEAQPEPTKTEKKTKEKAIPLDYENDVKPLAVAVSQKLGREALVALLEDFGAAKADQIDPTLYAEVVAYANKLLAAE